MNTQAWTDTQTTGWLIAAALLALTVLILRWSDR